MIKLSEILDKPNKNKKCLSTHIERLFSNLLDEKENNSKGIKLE